MTVASRVPALRWCIHSTADLALPTYGQILGIGNEFWDGLNRVQCDSGYSCERVAFVA